MTNLEHYGLDNLEFKEYNVGNDINPFAHILEIYYKAKHSKPIKLRSFPIYSNDDSVIRNTKVKWLLEEYKSFQEVFR